jgi:outer membrane protein
MPRSIQACRVKCALTLATLSLFSVTAAGTAFAEPIDPAASLTGKTAGLTSEQVARRASATSFNIEERRQEVQVAAASYDRALYDFIPKLSGQVSYFRLSSVKGTSLGSLVVAPGAPPGPLSDAQPLAATPLSFESVQNATTLSASLTLPLSDYVLRLFQTRAAARAQLDSASFSRLAAERKVAYDARALYYDWVRAELEAAAAEQNLQVGQQHLERLQALAAADSASPADVARVEATVASSELVLVQAKNLAELQRRRVAVTMHSAGAETFTIGEDLTRAPAQRPGSSDLVELTRQAEAKRPELQAAALVAKAYDKQADASWSRVLPRLDASGTATLANPNQRYFPQKDEFHTTWQVGVQLSFALGDTLSAKTQVDQARAQAAAARAERAQLVDAIHVEVSDAVLSERTARSSLDTSARRLRAAQTSYQARYQRFLVGQATTVELTEAQTELFNAQLEVVHAQVAIRVAQARVVYVTGGA